MKQLQSGSVMLHWSGSFLKSTQSNWDKDDKILEVLVQFAWVYEICVTVWCRPLHQTIVSSFSFVFLLRTAVTVFFFGGGGVRCDVIILMFTEIKTGTHIWELSLFPVPILRPFIPSGGSVTSVAYLHFWSARWTHKTTIVFFGWHNISIRPGIWASKKHQHAQFAFMLHLGSDSQRSLSYKNGIPQKHFPTA